MTTIEKAEKIKYLLQLKAPSHSLAEGLRYWSSPDTSAREAHLLTLPVEEIDHICLTEFNAMREQIEQWRFYSQSNARADFVHLGKLPYWSPGQTVALLLGKNVDLVNWETLKDFQYGDVADEKNAACEDKLNHLGIPDPSHIASEYLVTQFLKLAHRLHLSEVFINGELKIDPVSVLEWATRESIPIPAPLKTALKGKAAQPVQALANPIAIAGNSNEPQANTLPVDTATAPVVQVPAWKQMAVKRAIEIIERQRKGDYYPSQIVIAEEIAKEFRAASVMGVGGKPLTGAYIKRHALKGISSEQGKQLSTTTTRGK